MKLKCDFHIHTCLSPCGDLDASPNTIVRSAKAAGLDAIAICDHNSALNCATAIQTGKRVGLLVFPGIEVATVEEAHILAIFQKLEDALDLSALLYSLLPAADPGRFASGHIDQVYVDSDDVILGEVDKLLVSGADMGIDEVIEFVHSRNGLVIPSHIDRPAFSIPSQLGFFPDLDFDGVEIAAVQGAVTASSLPRAYPLITSSDAHHPNLIGGKYTEIDSESKDFEGIAVAIKAGRTSPHFP